MKKVVPYLVFRAHTMAHSPSCKGLTQLLFTVSVSSHTEMIICFMLLSVIMTRYVVCGVLCTFASEESGVTADCSNRRLTKLPFYLPDGQVSLDVSGNFLTSLHSLDDVRLANLRRLNVSHNSISTVPDDIFQGLSQLEQLDLSDNDLLPLAQHAFRGLLHMTSLVLRHTGLHVLPDTLLADVPQLVTLDLSFNALSSIPTVALSHAPSLTSLDLGDNNLTTVANHSLTEMNQLQTLNLRSNRLSTLQSAAFVGLGHLLDLDISNNQLLLDHTAYPPGVFSPLVALQSLYMHDNDDRDEGDYPLDVFTLRSLKTLTIDTFAKTRFGRAFSQLTSLTTLSLDNNCKMKFLTNTTFSAFRNSYLKTLVIAGCNLMSVEMCVFCSLPRLQVLRLVASAALLRLSSTLLAMYGLQNQNMSLIDLGDFYQATYPLTNLDSSNTKFLNNICVSSLKMNNCVIVGITPSAFPANTLLASCLRHFDLSSNSVGNIPKSVVWKLFTNVFINLISVNIRNQKTFVRIKPEQMYTAPENVKSDGQSLTLILPVPRSLELMDVAGAIYMIGTLPRYIQVHNGANVTFLDLSYCGIYSCMNTFLGLTSLRTLSVSGNMCNKFSDDYLDHVPTLRHLRLADMRLDQDYVINNATRLLSALDLLESLDLSDNDLHLLPSHLLRVQHRLQSFFLVGNKFQTIPVDLDQQTDLSLLDLSNNMLTTLLPHERRLLDALADNHTVHVRLRHNQLSCTCAGLEFVRWLRQTKVRLDGDIYTMGYDDDYDDNGRDYPCMLEDGSMSSTGAVMAEWEGHWRGCVGQTAFWAALVGLLIQLLGLMLTFIISRNWTYILYAWRVLRHLPLPRRLTFRSDVFLGHADHDFELAMRVKGTLQDRYDVRVLLPYLAIMPGDNWADGILRHVDDSWKIVLLVTRNFMQDRWSGFLVHHAQRCITDTMPDRVLVVFLEQPAQLLAPGPHHPDPARVSLQRLLRVVPDRNVFHVHKDTPSRHEVWGRLAQFILQE